MTNWPLRSGALHLGLSQPTGFIFSVATPTDVSAGRAGQNDDKSTTSCVTAARRDWPIPRPPLLTGHIFLCAHILSLVAVSDGGDVTTEPEKTGLTSERL